ncbi:MAG: nucleoside:proton symporter [Nitrospinae bacterium]|nr:nucleoside:proton symporter [Nitrospinota bacterium]
MLILQSALGLAVLVGVAWALSEDRKCASLKAAGLGVLVQLALGAAALQITPLRDLFASFSGLVVALEKATGAGTSFVFGYLGGGALPFDEKSPGSSFILALRALPLVLVVSALSAVLFYWRVMPVIVKGFAWALEKSMGLSGAAGLGTAANIFVGMIEAPLFIRPYLKELTRSELFIVMTAGMATIAGTMMALYASILGPVIPMAMGHILVASIISAPAAVTVARLMVPERGTPTAGDAAPPKLYSSTMDALTRGTADGLTLLINIVAMLIVMVAMVSLVNQTLGLLPEALGAPLTLERLFGWLLATLAWLIGVPWEEAVTAGSLLGVKVTLNEFLAYLQMAQLPEEALSERSELILTYAMCGFANFGSLGIMLGGMGAMVPERREEIVSLGMRSVAAGLLASCMTGAVVGLVG